MFREEDACFALALEGSQYPIGALDFEELLRFGSEYSVIQNTTLPFVKEQLASSVDSNNALFLTITLLDISVSLSARLLASQIVDTLLETNSNFSFVQNRLQSLPMPVQQRADRRSVMQLLANFPRTHDLLKVVFEAQPLIDQIRYEWVEMFRDAGTDSHALSDLETQLTEAGFFSAVVRAVDAKDLQRMNGEVVGFASSTDAPNSRAILTTFRSRIERAFWGPKKKLPSQSRLNLEETKEVHADKRHGTGDLIFDLLAAADDPGKAQRRVGALQAKARVDSQIAGIRELLFAGKTSKVEKYLKELLEFQLGQGDREYAVMSLCSLSAIAIDANQLEMADRLSEYALRLGEYDVVAHTIRAEVFKNRGHFQSALRAYEETNHRFPGNRYALNGYADVLKELGEFEQSIRRYIEIQQQFPEDPVAFNGQVSTLRAAGRFREALDVSFRNAKRFQFDPVARNVLGGCLATVGKLDEAVKQYRRAFELDASDPHLRVAYAYALRSVGRYREAIQVLDADHATGPRQSIIANSKANILRTIGELNPALTVYLDVLSMFPCYTPAKFGAAAVRILLNQVDDAVQDLPCDHMESELDWIGFRTYALSFISRDAANAAVERLKWGIANCPWRAERIRMETALGFAQIKAKNPESIVTLQHNLDRLEDRPKQTRLLFLGVAQAEAGDRVLANMILTRVFSSKDRELRSLNSALIDYYNPRNDAPPVDSALIYRQQMNLAMAA